MPTDLSEGAASPLPKGSPAAAVAGASGEGGAAASPGGGATGQEVGGAGDSSDEGGEEENVVERVYDGQYSEEDTDEEVELKLKKICNPIILAKKFTVHVLLDFFLAEF